MAVIRGARGLIYFVHKFKPTFNDAALSDLPISPLKRHVQMGGNLLMPDWLCIEKPDECKRVTPPLNALQAGLDDTSITASRRCPWRARESSL